MQKVTVGKFEVVIVGKTGYFEHVDLGDECGGGLWFEKKQLEDYDGVPELPKDVIKGIRKLGYTVPREFE